MTTESPSISDTSSKITNTYVQFAFDIVNWDALSALGRKLHQVDSSHWGEHVFAGYNLHRFLHLHDAHNTILVARVPFRYEDAMTPRHDAAISKQVASEVATMEYVERYTNVKVPHVFHHSAGKEGDVGSPYILMSKVDGVQLSTVWDKMEDDKRRIILRQAINILLELWSIRFDKSGVLFKRPGYEGKDAWYIEPSFSRSFFLEDPENIGSRHNIPTTAYTHAVDYWVAYTNANLHDISDANFGSSTKMTSYIQTWTLRSLIPALFDPSIDAHGCPLSHGDFHSQNIMIADVDTSSPRITGIMGWEFSGPDFATAFAQYPLFIVCSPALDENHPMRKRSVQDQATFNELILDAERTRNPVSGPPLSGLIPKSYPIFLFQHIMRARTNMRGVLYPHLFTYIFGDSEGFPSSYERGLQLRGILKEDSDRFDREYKVWLEVRYVLGRDAVDHFHPTMGEFRDLVLKHLDRFNEGNVVREWLASANFALI